jgi:hypothetical protein
MQPNSLAQSSEMPLHGTCFMGAGWSFIAIFAQQSPAAVCAAPKHAGAMNAAGGIACTAEDNEQSPEDQDPHVCNIRRSPPLFKVRFAGVILTGGTCAMRAAVDQRLIANNGVGHPALG